MSIKTLRGISFSNSQVIDKIKKKVKNKLWNLNLWLGDLANAIYTLAVLKPAADFLPRRLAYDLVTFWGFLECRFSLYGRSKKRSMQRLLKLEEDLAFQVTSEYLARPLRDFVVLRRILNGREDHKNWLVEEKNVELLQSLRASGKSFIIATGHFSREAFVPLYFQSTIPENITSLVAYPIPATLNPYVLLVSIRWAQMTEYLQLERPDMKIINSGQINNLRALVASLNGSGNVLIMSADSPWAPQYGKCLKRRFVGIEGREFAIGTATLSRLSQCPIVTCYPHLDKSGKVIIEWGKRFDPYPREDKKSDQQLTDLILNEIEEQIKLRPSQYAVDFLD